MTAPWHDTSLPVTQRADALLAAMTLEEKVQQLGSTWPGEEDAGGDVAPMQETFRGAQPFDEAVAGGLGQLTRPFGTAPVEPADGIARLAGLQEAVRAANRFGLPAVVHEECLTGFTAWRATVYPTSLAWAAAWDPSLVERMGAAIGRDLASVGVHQGLAPVLDVVRDYRWGRVEETMGEDPCLVGETGAAYVTGLQSAGVVATLKHFAGYAASRGARNHAPVSIGPRELADVVLPPFERAVVGAGVRSVMNSYADLDGVPPSADPALLTTLLREEWGFAGTVVSDYWAVPFLESTHRVAADLDEAGRLALAAGLDVELPHTLGFGPRLVEAVRAGHLDEAFVDRAALRVLVQKAELGLLDADWRPVPASTTVDLDSPGNRALAAELAAESVVLLANDGTLPLSAPAAGAPPRRVAVLGPVADDPGCLFGCYSFPNHVVAKNPGTALGVDAPTFLDALRAELPEDEVVHEPGAAILDAAPDPAALDRAAEAAARADLVVLMVGDRSGMFGHGTSGEGCDAVDLRLPGSQEALVERVLGVGTPVVLVVVSGRPYAIGEHAARAAATLQVFFPGEEGAGAVAGVLAGRLEPGGRLPVQVPGPGVTTTYLGPPLAQASDGVSNLDPTPAFAFGHGLSYGDVVLDGVRLVGPAEVATDGAAEVSVTVTNRGDRPGTVVPQLYLSDPVASVVQPVRRLVGFAKVRLAPGESARLRLDVPADLAAFTDRTLTRVVEPGALVLTVATSAADPGHPLALTLVGERRRTGRGRAFAATAEVRTTAGTSA
ncbi:beta-glucosidase [Nocardioides bruguierae]|uniref:beta-glucosidase n=1 Tax=Nocardioides bruguierae TaxID=2945102 RepID=UPI002020997F|nr:glycoside hydrolase family 3 N-terminal domain-containing protein [Nocardioides bruguierae]MCL8025311.1 glycoside hydrolase family 3 C-terminal domain-containing protein [Nocardioides bruguierae]